MRFTVDENFSGLLVPPADPQAMADGITQIVADRDFRASLQVGARQAAIRFSWHTIGASMLQLYERLAAGEPHEPLYYTGIYAS
jgi:D-inositol-3-phosphate glycosyltransferase